MIHVMARIVVKPESAAAAREMLSALAAETVREEGCIAYALYQQAGHPYVFRTVEQWSDQAAADRHMKSAHVQQAIAAGASMFAAAPEIHSFDRVV